MATGKFDLAAASDIMKEQYDPHEAYKILTEEDPFLGLIERKEGVLVGKNFKSALQYGTGRGVATTLAKARLGKSTNLYQDVQLTRGRVYGVGSIDRETMHSAKTDKAAFVDSLESQMDGVFHTIAERAADWSYKDGGGSIGVVKSFTGATITLTDPIDAQNFQEDGQYEIALNNGLTGGIEAGLLTCAGVDRDSGVVTFTANVATGVPTTANGAYIFPAGDHANTYKDSYGMRVIVGLDGWLPLAAPGATPFFGIDRSKDPVRLGGCRYNGKGAAIEETITKALGSFSVQGAKKIDMLLMNELRLTDLIVSLGDKVRFDTKTNEVTKVGFSGVTFVTSNGKVTCFGTPHCKLDRAYALQKDTWRLLTMRKFPELIEDDGLTIRRATDGSDGYDFEAVGYAQIDCTMPGKNGVIQF